MPWPSTVSDQLTIAHREEAVKSKFTGEVAALKLLGATRVMVTGVRPEAPHAQQKMRKQKARCRRIVKEVGSRFRD
jgi:hypothetical protein